MLIIISLLLILSVGFHSFVTGGCSYSGGFCRIWVFFFFCLCQHWNELCVWLWPLVLEAFPRMKFFLGWVLCTSERQIKSLPKVLSPLLFPVSSVRAKIILLCLIVRSTHLTNKGIVLCWDWIWAAVMSCREAPGCFYKVLFPLEGRWG